MSNTYFQFKQFTIHQDRCAMKVTTDGCLFGGWAAERVCCSEFRVRSLEPESRKLLDIGAGTGLLSMMIAQKNKLLIDVIEIDRDAFEQASENISLSPWADRIKIFNADVRDFEFTKQYDIIISNPPFYEKELKGDNNRKNIAHHDQGLHITELLSVIKKNLKPDGTFFLLIPFKRNEEIKNIFTENDLFISQLIFVRSTTNHNFFRIMLEGKIKTENGIETKIDEISIKDENDQYTKEFISLLKDFYLHL